MPLYTGDYLRDTRHLTPLRHGIYLLALMHCWDSKGPLPLDEQECAGICNCRSADEIDALRYIVNRYFVRMEDGHYNGRIQAEVVRSESLSTVRADAGRRGANERMRRFRESQASAKQVLNTSSASVEQVTLSPSPSPSLTPDQTKETKTTRAPRTSPSLAGVDPQIASDWIAMRKQKRAAVTETAIAGIRREAEKAGLSLQDALAMCCARGWTGFKADWVKRDGTNGVNRQLADRVQRTKRLRPVAEIKGQHEVE